MTEKEEFAFAVFWLVEILKSKFLAFLFVFLFGNFNIPNLLGQNPRYAPGEIILKLKSYPSLNKSTSTSRSSFGMPTLDALSGSVGVLEIQALMNINSPRVSKSLGTLFKLKLPDGSDLEKISAAYLHDPNVEYVQPNYIHQIDFAPNDSLLSQQSALKIIQAEEAWEQQLASADVIVGVIDTGIDHDHEDLRDALWINAGEDLNGNGKVDSTDFNGLDDDNNGYIDDIQGWDFTDAPSFPDGGDYRTPDNDPFDDNGHGTSVAGIIGATGDNRHGIAGLAYGSQIMNLRAGTSLGFLEEDDVASAIVYAVENGARIINMSFGDEVASPLLRDVVEYAASQNCVLVASAGNSNSDKIHFPSGFAETISVGATTENDGLAGFSNFGSSVDVVAPGVNILTTQKNNAYGNFSGTSASAPLVSALAALLLSKTPDLPYESVKGVLTSTTDDLGDMGWDNFFASGRINASKALSSPAFSVARITAPKVNQGFAASEVAIRGTAAGAFLQEYILELGVGENPMEWTELFRQQNRQVIDELLFSLDIAALQDTLYTLRLIVNNKNGTEVEDKVPFFIDRTQPVISDIRQTPMIDGAGHSFLLEFQTDDLCDAAVYFRPLGSAEKFEKLELRFRTTEHRVNFTQDIFTGNLEFFIEAVNGAGLSASSNNNGRYFTADLSAFPIGGAAIEKLDLSLPSAFLLAKIADFDDDNLSELIANQYDADFNFGPLKIFEFTAGHFQKTFSSMDTFIPRDWGDSDGDGLREILAGRGGRSFILEAPSSGQFPSEIVWSDSNEVWASRFADLDQDGLGEIILRLKDLFTVWETSGDNEYALIDSLPNPTSGSNFVGVPHSEVGDFDGDGRLEILLGDFDGDVYIYENVGDNRYQFTWSDSLPLVDTIDFLSQGDYDGDGVPEFVVGCHSDPSLNTESTFDSRHWLYRVYKKDHDNSFHTAWEQAFFGFQSPADFDSGVSSGDVDNDGHPEILLNVFPDFYIVDYDANFSEYQIIWHTQPNRSNSTVVADFDGDGFNEFYFNNGTEVVGYRFIPNFNGPTTPVSFQAHPLDSTVVELDWRPSQSRNGFQIYRGASPQDLALLSHVQTPPYLDSTVSANAEYWFTVTALDSTLSPVESLPAVVTKVKPDAKPFLAGAVVLAPRQVQLTFSEPMNQTVKDQTHFQLEDIGTPTSSVVHQSGKRVILTSPSFFSPGTHRVTAINVADLNGTPIDPARNSAIFEVTAQPKAPYLVSATLLTTNQLYLEFSEPLDAVSASQPENYIIEPEVKIEAAALNGQDPKVVTLQIDPDSPIGPFGIEYFITVRNIKNQQGIAIRFGEGDAAALIFSSPDLSQVFVYPNPYRSGSSQDYLTIAGLTRSATVKILDASGRLLRTLQETDGNGGVRWDLKDEDGNQMASGIYVFYVVGEGKRAVGKFAVVR